MKKFMTEKQMLLSIATAEELSQGEAVFLSTFQESPWLASGVKAGYYQAHTVKIEGLPRYVVIWHKSDQNQMLVNFCAQLNGGECFDALIEAVKGIGRHFNCSAVQVITARSGLVRKLQEKQFKPFGVALELSL